MERFAKIVNSLKRYFRKTLCLKDIWQDFEYAFAFSILFIDHMSLL